MMEQRPARNPSILHLNQNLSIWWEIKERRATLLELTMNKIKDVDGVHGVVLVLPSSSSSSSSIFPPILSLSSSRVHPCSWGVERERESDKWMGGWEGATSADEVPQLVLTCGSHSLKWQITHFPLTAVDLRSIGRAGRTDGLSSISLSLPNWFYHWLAGYCRSWVVLSWGVLWGWVGVDDVNRISPNPLGVSLLALGVSLTMAIWRCLRVIFGGFSMTIRV